MFRFLVSILSCLSFITSYAQSPLDSVVTLGNTSLKTQKIIVPFPSQSQLNTDRPSFSDNSYVLPPGGFQHENGFQINAQENAPHNTNYTGALPFSSFRLGVLKGFELRMATALLRNPENTPTPYGLSDLELGTKIQLFENVAWISHLGIPNGSNGYSNEKFYSSHKVSATLATEQSSFVINTGVRFSRNPNNGQKERNWLNTLVAMRNINRNTFVFGEVFLMRTISGEGLEAIATWKPGFDFGFAHKFTDNTQIDFSYGYIKNQPFLSVGFSWGAFKSQFKPIRTPEF
jgi:hypothetical protein